MGYLPFPHHSGVRKSTPRGSGRRWLTRQHLSRGKRKHVSLRVLYRLRECVQGWRGTRTTRTTPTRMTATARTARTACQNPYIHDHFFCSLLARYDDQYTSIPSTSDIFFGYQPASAAPSDGRALRVDTQALS
jgi:hypothetical protein